MGRGKRGGCGEGGLGGRAGAAARSGAGALERSGDSEWLASRAERSDVYRRVEGRLGRRRRPSSRSAGRRRPRVIRSRPVVEGIRATEGAVITAAAVPHRSHGRGGMEGRQAQGRRPWGRPRLREACWRGTGRRRSPGP